MAGWLSLGELFSRLGVGWRPMKLLVPGFTLFALSFRPAALVVRFLTKRFIGDYERNAGEEMAFEENAVSLHKDRCSHFSVSQAPE